MRRWSPVRARSARKAASSATQASASVVSLRMKMSKLSPLPNADRDSCMAWSAAITRAGASL